jgi:hypothetical protein
MIIEISIYQKLHISPATQINFKNKAPRIQQLFFVIYRSFGTKYSESGNKTEKKTNLKKIFTKRKLFYLFKNLFVFFYC